MPFGVAAPPVGAEAALVAATDGDAADAEEPASTALLMGAMSLGMTLGASPLRSTVPSSFSVSGLAPRNERVYMTFSRTRLCDQSGRLARSMFEPQFAALSLFAVMVSVNARMAARSELLETAADICWETEVETWYADGGLIIPNIPFWQ